MRIELREDYPLDSVITGTHSRAYLVANLALAEQRDIVNKVPFSSACREINKVSIANLPEPVFYDDGSVGYAVGTYTEEEIKGIMRPLREDVDKYRERMDSAATLKDVLLQELERYTGEGLNDSAYLTISETEGIYTIIDYATVRGKRHVDKVLMAPGR